MLYVVNSWGSFVVVDYFFFLEKLWLNAFIFQLRKSFFLRMWLYTPVWLGERNGYRHHFSGSPHEYDFNIIIVCIFHWWKAIIICIYMQHMIINQRCYYVLRRMHKINKLGHNWKSLPATWPINGWRFKNFISFLLRFLFLKK